MKRSTVALLLVGLAASSFVFLLALTHRHQGQEGGGMDGMEGKMPHLRSFSISLPSLPGLPSLPSLPIAFDNTSFPYMHHLSHLDLGPITSILPHFDLEHNDTMMLPHFSFPHLNLSIAEMAGMVREGVGGM
ncbi:hypothetical protein B484DRAFT_415550, partial [Ochromonadaceae sp. CCMP2298]